MQETHTRSGPGLSWLLIIAAAITIPLIIVVNMIGDERIYVLARTFVTAISAAVVLLAVAVCIRAYRKRDAVDEHHYTHDGTTVKEIHYGVPPPRQVLQLGSGRDREIDPLAFPGLYRAAYQAGAAPREEQRIYAGRYGDGPDLADELPAEAFEGDDDIVVNRPEWTGSLVQ